MATTEQRIKSRGSRRFACWQNRRERLRNSAGRPAPGKRIRRGPSEAQRGLGATGPQVRASTSGTRAAGALGPAPTIRCGPGGAPSACESCGCCCQMCAWLRFGGGWRSKPPIWTRSPKRTRCAGSKRSPVPQCLVTPTGDEARRRCHRCGVGRLRRAAKRCDADCCSASTQPTRFAGVAPLCLLAKSARKAAKFRRAARPRETNPARLQRSAVRAWGHGAPKSARAQAERAPQARWGPRPPWR